MPPTYETGHAINIANFQLLISYCLDYGTAYNPSKSIIQISALQSKLTEAENALLNVNVKLTPWVNAVNQRQLLFDPFRSFISRLVSAVIASDVSIKDIADVKSIARKIQGRRAVPVKPPVAPDPESPPSLPVIIHSASQQSFDNRMENFSKLIQFLTVLPAYTPNETDLTMSALSAMLDAMHTANEKVIEVYPHLSNARIARNKVLYNKSTGMLYLAAQVKSYIKSLFGPSSAQYHQVSILKFKYPSY
jgi:hypothetical protein